MASFVHTPVWGFVLLAAGCGGHSGVTPPTPSENAPAQSNAPFAERVRQLERSVAEKDSQIEELRRQLASAMRDVAEQRQLLREDALHRAGQSVDEMLALFPARFPAGNWSAGGAVFEDCWFQTVDGLRLHGWYLPHKSPKATILYVHGNAGNITVLAGVAAYLQQRFRTSVLLFDYRGYGRSEGVPTVDGLVRDAAAARDYLALRERIPSASVVLMGQSLGGAVAVELAARDGARGLVLASTFSSLRDVAVAHYPELLVDLLVADRLNSAARIAAYHGPVLVSHGDADRTIPFELGLQLYEAANEPKTFVRIPGGCHNDLPSGAYARELERFLDSLPAP